MPVNSIILATANEDNSTPLIEVLNELLPETRKFPGCISMKILRSHDNPNDFVFFGEWDSAADYQKYLEYREEQGALDSLAKLLTAPPTIKILNDTDI